LNPVVDAAAPASVPPQAKAEKYTVGPSAGPSVHASVPVKTCDKKERNKNKCTSDATDELHQQHGPKDYAGHVGSERNGSSSFCEQCHAIRGTLIPYLDNWSTLLEIVGELNLRHSYNNTCNDI
jgi:hypothetical protein